MRSSSYEVLGFQHKLLQLQDHLKDSNQNPGSATADFAASVAAMVNEADGEGGWGGVRASGLWGIVGEAEMKKKTSPQYRIWSLAQLSAHCDARLHALMGDAVAPSHTLLKL